MKFVFTATLALAFTQLAMAAGALDITAKSASGFNVFNKSKVTGCVYSVVPSSDRSSVKIYVNSDSQSDVNFAFEIPASDIPLRDGYEIHPYNKTSITFKNGVLRSTAVDDDQPAGPLAQVNEVVEIAVSADLQLPSKARGTSTLTGMLHPFGSVEKRLECKF